MDEKTIFNEIIGQLALIVQQQTQTIVDAVTESKTNSSDNQKIDIVVSGNTLSLMDTIVRNDGISKRITDVASSFNVLNRELEDYESIFKGISDIYYKGAGGQVGYIVDFLNVLTDADYVSRINDANSILETQKNVLSNFFSVFYNDDFLEQIQKSSEVLETHNIKIGEFFGVFEKLMKNSAFVNFDFEKNTKGVKSIVSFINLLSDSDFIEKLDNLKKNFDKNSMNDVVEFFVRTVDGINTIKMVSENTKNSIDYIIGIAEKMKTQDFRNVSEMIKGVDFVLRILNQMADSDFISRIANLNQLNDSTFNIGYFFKNTVDGINGIGAVSDDSKQSIEYILSLVQGMNQNKIFDSLSSLREINSDDAMFVEFFKNAFEKIQSIGEIGLSNKNSIETLTVMVNEFGSNEFLSKVRNLENLSSVDFAKFLSNAFNTINGIGEIGLSNKQSVQYLGEMMMAFGSPQFGEIANSLSRIINSGVIDSLGDFVSRNIGKFGSVGEISDNQKKSIGYLISILNSMDRISLNDRSIENISNLLNKVNSVQIIDFFVSMSERLGNLQNITKEQVNYINSLVNLINTLGQENVLKNIENVSSKINKNLGTKIGQFFNSLSQNLNELPSINREQKEGIGYILTLLNFIGQEEIGKRISNSASKLNPKIARNIASFFTEFVNEIEKIQQFDKKRLEGIESVLRLLNIVSQEGFVSRMVSAHMFIGERTGRSIGMFFNGFMQSLGEIEPMTVEQNRSLNNIVNLLNTVMEEGFVRKMVFANMFIGEKTGESLGKFFNSFASEILSIENIDNNKFKGLRDMQSILSNIVSGSFPMEIFFAGLILGKNTGSRLGQFFSEFSNELGTINGSINTSFLDSYIKLLDSITSPWFIGKIALANQFYGKNGNGNWTINPLTIPRWWYTHLVHEVNNARDFGWIGLSSGSITQRLDGIANMLVKFADIIQIITRPFFVTKLETANRVYGKNANGSWRVNPLTIPEWYKEFFTGFNSMGNVDNTFDVKKFKNIIDFIDSVSSPLFMAKIAMSNMIYRILNPTIIATFFIKFIEEMNNVFDNVSSLTSIQNGVNVLNDVVDGILAIGAKLLLVGLIGTVMIAALPGLAVMTGVLVGLTWLMDWMVQKMTSSGELYNEALNTLNDCVLKLSLSLMIIALAMVIADKIGMGALKIIVPMLGILALFGIVVLIDKLSKQFNVSGAITEITLNILLLSLAMIALTGAMILANNNIQTEGMVMFFAVVLGMAAIVGLLALIQYTGIAPMAALAGLAIAGVMLVMSLVFLIVMKVLEMATSAVKDLPMIKMLIVGIVDIMWTVTLQTALMGVVAPAMMLFAIATGMLLTVAAFAVMVGKISTLFTPKDKLAVKNVVQSMIEVFGLVDDYFSENTFGSSIPVIGTAAKLLNAIGSTATLILFVVSLGVLMMVTGLTVVVAKMSRLVNATDISSLKELIGGMIDVFGMIDEYFSSKTFGSSIPVVGAVAKLVTALGASVSLILFSVSLGVLMTITTLSIAVMKLARVVTKRDVDGLKNVVQGMIDIFEMVGGTFLFGLLDNISKAASVGLFSAAMTPLLALTSWYISLTRKYYDADVQIGGIGKVSKQLVADFKGFMDAFNNSFSIWDAIATTGSSIIATSMIPLMGMVGKFVDIVAKVATMTFITGYDRNGKPIFTKVDDNAFENASTTLTNGFKTFLTGINESFSGDLKNISTRVIENLVVTMIPLMNVMSMYVDSVVKLSTAQVIEKYDNNGKPVYKQLDFSENGDGYKAATALSTLFNSFVTNLVTETNKLKINNTNAMKALSESMMPLMMGVSSFADAIVKLGTSMVPCEWDKDGKPIKFKHVEESVYSNAATVLANNFGKFIEVLRQESDKMSGASKDEAECLSKCMTDLMTGIGAFADAIVKLGTSGIPVYKNGKIDHYEKINAKVCAETLIGSDGVFTVFMNSLSTGFSSLDGQTKDSIKLLSSAMEPLMTGISMFVDSIVKMGTGTYVDHYDKNGKPVTKLIPSSMYLDAAKIISDNFGTFVTNLRDNLYNSKGKIQLTLDALNKGGIADVMTSVGNFVDALSKFANGKFFVIQGFDKNGKPIYMKEKGKLKTVNMSEIATNIANGFSIFVSTLVTKLGDESVKSKIEGAKTVIAQLSSVMDPVSDFVDTIIKFKDGTGKQNFGTLGSEIGSGLINILKSMDGDGMNKESLIKKYGAEDFNMNLEYVIGNVDSVMDAIEDFLDLKIESDLNSKTKNAGTAIINLLRYVDGGENSKESMIAKYGSDKMTNDIYKLSLNFDSAINSIERFNDFGKFDFKEILNSEKSFAEALRFIMTIDFAKYEPVFGASVNKTITHLNSLDKKLEKSAKVVTNYKDAFAKAIDTIESKLSKNEKSRNEKFVKLTKNLEAVANKLQSVNKGLRELSNQNFSWADKLNRQLNNIVEAQTQQSSFSLFGGNNSNKQNSGNNSQNNKNNGFSWDGETPIPVYMVNAPQGQDNEKIGLLVEINGSTYKGKMSPSLLGR